MAKLFEPLQLGNIELKNRIAVSPTCEYSSVDGFAADWHLVHLGSRAVGGAGLIIAEATAVSPEGRITPDDLGIWKDEHISFLQRITAFIKEQGSVPGIQLAHAGRKASHQSPWKGGQPLTKEEGAWQTVGPSASPFKEGTPAPEALSKEGIRKVIDDFKAATTRALKAGFEVIEIHAAHGYLLHQFYSPLSNLRSDEYGGSFANRIRLTLEIVNAVKNLLPQNFPLLVRISATDWIDTGWTVEDSVELCKELKKAGVHLVDCSSGGNALGARIPLGPMYQTSFAARIKKEAGIMTGAVGLITTATEAENILQNNEADLILLARQFLRDPYFPLHAAKELGVDAAWPVQYQRAKN
ncbi:NADH:flavin oxidoreductase/NADH oxidase [Flavisolibacter ginsenosidimutans]|uniref:NADH:flavin oxidoreductase/NADH oxidase n=1 Tax=Flavisolibacter ginsenosidimutans TaxID=661481 RepID=A0A5B8UH15_9BACT|nr:NADH:flavin oxidoreductase/NADH oxidase [Flavisolibacter ginsenosidimutans]QEC55924.1 NADH:flavin oxidoreductase/NADH oxidase [Flavisolibacter ginsenosidimutans]